jgi:chorismate mutase
MDIVSLRGATTVLDNSSESIDRATLELMEKLIESNKLTEDQVISVIFSATGDITARYPAVVLREKIGWTKTAIMNVEEKFIQDQLAYCIRVLVTLKTENPGNQLKHVYLNGAAGLRPDWVSET